MKTTRFFDESGEQSVIKATIVAKYFWAWAKIMIANQKRQGREKIGYVDLFCGPGRYKDGSVSTPVMVLQKAVADPDLRQRIVTMFNDKNENYTRSLSEEIEKIPNVCSLKYKPEIYNEEVNEEMAAIFEATKLVPTLSFIDPWGYKGLTLRLVNALIKDWGCDCIFFFNYNRINMGLTNDFVKEHIDAIFEETRGKELRTLLEPLSSAEREFVILEELIKAIQERGGNHVLPFCFKNAQGQRTSHHLIFVSKHPLGYTIMKEIMAKCSSESKQAVPTFQYTPVGPKQQTLFEFTRPLDHLGPMLLNDFAGRKLKMREIFEQHHIGKPYIGENYKEVLKELEKDGKIVADPPMDKRRKRKDIPTFGDDVMVKFPKEVKS